VCGVRKVWSKLFDGIEDQPSKQIKMLRKMLEDLGMEGRPSMEKAKAIKAKRELEDELGESELSFFANFWKFVLTPY
jgi:L-fucose isomerase-like protein